MNLNNKSIVVVGSSGELLNHSLGKKIDEFDIVIRLNRGITKGYEQYVGSKHDIWTCGCCTEYYINMGNSELQSYQKGLNKESKESILNQLSEIWILRQKKPHHTNTDTSMFSKYDINLKIYREDYDNRHFDIYKDNGFKPTMGIVALKVLTDTVDKVYITGIDLYGYIFTELDRKKAPYEYKWYYHNERNRRCPVHHNQKSSCHSWQEDAKYVKSLIKQGKLIVLKEDTEITKSKLLPKQDTKCRVCNKSMSIYKWQDNICNKCVLNKDNW